jgi:hypothetical protein
MKWFAHVLNTSLSRGSTWNYLLMVQDALTGITLHFRGSVIVHDWPPLR